ncbi:Renal dipeptidase [Bacillus sp. MRMR6]|nr:Renal dipeptidase [Bacillus sp. MRMR6]
MFLLDILNEKADGYNEHYQHNLKNKLADMDWQLFLDLVAHHRLYPIIYTKLKRINEGLVPNLVFKKINNAYKKNTFQMLHLTAVMEEVSRIFTGNNLRLLVLKGPVLAEDLYGDISKRTCRDLDILVSIEDIIEVHHLLEKIGFEQEEEFQIDLNLNDWKWRHHHLSFYHPKKHVKIEVHWRLNPGPGREPSFNDLWERKRISSLTNYPVHYLGREDLFFFLITHGARHGWSRLRWLVDIDLLARQNIKWEFVTRLLLKYQFLYLGGQALKLSSKLLETPIDQEMKLIISDPISTQLAQNAIFYFEEMVNLHSEHLPERIESYHNQYLLSLMTTKQKLLFFLSVLYPSITDVKTIKLPKRLYFLYFPLRPFLLAIRRTKKHSISK